MGNLENKKAHFQYEILETFLVGIQLLGWEVKSIRMGNINFSGAWIKEINNELFLENLKISAYKNASQEQNENRLKKILLTKEEQKKIEQKRKEKGWTMIPFKIINSGRFIKCEIALVRGKKKHDKKETLKQRSQEKEIRQTLKNFNSCIR